MATGTEQCAPGQASVLRRAAPLAVAGGIALFVLSRLVAIRTTALNWDEFGLLDRAARTARSGVPATGGRPGLVEWLLLPFVSACSDEITTARSARLLWLAATLVFLAGAYVLLRELLRGRPHARHDALFGVALLAFVPAFLEWSLQIRTDQLALVGGVWGGALLLMSQRRVPLALAAGVLLGAGYLASQKLLYVAALAGLLAAGRAWLASDLRPGREALRATYCLAGFGLVFAGFRAAFGAVFDVPPDHPSQRVMTPYQVGRALDVFAFYRSTIGLSQYRAMLPTLVPHALLLAACIAASVRALRRRESPRTPLALAWAVLALGFAVGAFHAGAFFYFWMTLGLFPAVGLALALEPLRAALPAARPRIAGLAAAGLWAALAVPAAFQSAAMLADTQSVQRESLTFVHRNFEAADAGFHPERALFCRTAAPPLPFYFSQTIYRDFAGPEAETNLAHVQQRFRRTPVKFLVQSFRLNQFPVELRRFWAENYQPYRASVFVAGRRLEGARGATSEFEVIAPGRYRWLPRDGSPSVRIDETLVGAGEIVALGPGTHSAGFVDDVRDGMLVLALADPPGTAPLAFYKVY